MISKKRVRAFKKRVIDPQKELASRGSEGVSFDVAKEYEVFLNTSDVQGILNIEPKPTKGISGLWPVIPFEKGSSDDHPRSISGEEFEEALIEKLGELEKPHKKIAKRIRVLLIFLILFTIPLLHFASFFRFDQYVSHVQEWYKDPNLWTKFFFLPLESKIYGYFIVDFFWGFLLAFLLFEIHRWFTQWHSLENAIQGSGRDLGLGSFFLSKWFLRLIFFVACFATLMDWLEFPLNFMGLGFWKGLAPDTAINALHWVVPLKYGAFSILLLNAAFQGIYYLFTRQRTREVIKQYYQQNTTTLIVIVILLFIVTRLGQGGALVENLFEKPLQYILVFILLLNVLALMTWRWPYYHNLFKMNHPFNKISFAGLLKRIPPTPLKKLDSLFQAFFTIISLNNAQGKFQKEKSFHQNINWYDLQRIQALMLFVLPMYAFIEHWVKSGGKPFLSSLTLIALVGLIWGYFRVKRIFDDNVLTPGHKPARFWKLFRVIAWICISLMLICLSLLLLENFVQLAEWKILVLFFYLLSNAVLYIPLMIGRSYLQEGQGLGLFNALFGNDIWFRVIFMVIGWASFVGVILLNVYYTANTWMSPINVALVYVIFVFSALNFIVKGSRVTFYPLLERSDKLSRIQGWYWGIVAISVVSLLGLYVNSNIIGENYFHEQEQIETLSQSIIQDKAQDTTNYVSHVTKGIPFETYFQSRWDSTMKDSSLWHYDPSDSSRITIDEPFYLIASDGGGLRAAYWTLLVLDHLDSLSGEKLYERTLAMSGASGGMIGLGMYMAIKNHQDTVAKRKEAIHRIGNANFFSNDLAFLLGKNIFKNFAPGDVSWMDDGSEKMALHYMKIAKDTSDGFSIADLAESIPELGMAYREVWYENYIKSEKNYPLLLTNSTHSEEAKKGIASPLRYEEEIFKASMSMLDFPLFPDTSLSYADALFTTNRFPVLSQAAQIRNKGHFIDGGGFDNSGISSLVDLIDYMKTKHDSLYEKYKGNIILISIHNDGATYITNHFEEFRDKVSQTKPLGEFSPIINVGYTRGILGEPAFMEDLAEQWEAQGILREYIEIDLPFPINRERVQNVYKGQLETPPQNSIQCHDRRCDPIQEKVDLLNSFTFGSFFREGENDPSYQGLIEVYGEISNGELTESPPFNKYIKEALNKGDNAYLVEPTLGRILSEPAVDYMQKMLSHPEVIDKLNQLSGKE